MTTFKKGNKVVCHTTCYMDGDKNRICLIKGKSYNIIDVNDFNLYIIDEEGDRHSFGLTDYTKWFVDKLITERKEKLNNFFYF